MGGGHYLLFNAQFDVLLYDLTSTYIEGEGEEIPKARYGYSRDRRFDCLQVVIVISREPEVRFPLSGSPADKPISIPALPGRGTKQQAGQQPTLAIDHQILQVLSHRATRAEIVELRQRRGQFLPTRAIGTDLLHLDSAQFLKRAVA